MIIRTHIQSEGSLLNLLLKKLQCSANAWRSTTLLNNRNRLNITEIKLSTKSWQWLDRRVDNLTLFLHQEYWELAGFPAVFSPALLQILLQQIVCGCCTPSGDDNVDVRRFPSHLYLDLLRWNLREYTHVLSGMMAFFPYWSVPLIASALHPLNPLDKSYS